MPSRTIVYSIPSVLRGSASSSHFFFLHCSLEFPLSEDCGIWRLTSLYQFIVPIKRLIGKKTVSFHPFSRDILCVSRFKSCSGFTQLFSLFIFPSVSLASVVMMALRLFRPIFFTECTQIVFSSSYKASCHLFANRFIIFRQARTSNKPINAPALLCTMSSSSNRPLPAASCIVSINTEKAAAIRMPFPL